MAGFNVISSAYFQALGHGVLALWVSIIRQLVVLLPTAWLLRLAGRVELVWWAFPIAEVVALTLCVIFQRVCYNKIIRPMRSETVPA